MKEIYQTSQFKKDFKRAKKRGKDIDKLKDVVGLIIKDQPLSERHRDHGLGGKWSGSRDCHIEPDWVLIYRVDGDALYLERTGTHSDLFRK
jgi:mRNA interferase YafQ